jgi:hypothetical protein
MRNKSLICLIGFLSIAVCPQPFLCLATILGMILSLRFLEWDHFFRRCLVISFLMILIILVSALINNTPVGYEEQKRLIGVGAVVFNLIFFRKYLSKWKFGENGHLFAFLVLCIAFLFSTLVWYKFKIVESGSDYSWVKFYGACPLAILASQLSTSPLFRKLNISICKLGALTGVILFISGAKSAAFLVVFGTFAIHKFRSLGEVSNRQNKFGMKSQLKILLLFRFVFIAFLLSSFFWYLGDRGFLGVKSQTDISQYGSNFLGALYNARPELQISLSALRTIPWYGFGTPDNALGYGFGYLTNSSEISAVNMQLINMRVLGSGLNVHSWFFEMVLRGGIVVALLFIPIVLALLRVLKHPELFVDYPGLYIASLFTAFDLFFSPLTWFSPIQISLSLVAIEIGKFESEKRSRIGRP